LPQVPFRGFRFSQQKRDVFIRRFDESADRPERSFELLDELLLLRVAPAEFAGTPG